MRKLFHVLQVLVTASLALAACAPAATQAPAPTVAPTVAAPTQAPAPTAAPTEPAAMAEKKILRVRMTGDLTNADPAFHPAGTDTITAETVGQGLVSFKPGTWELENVLAESIKASEDGLRIEFKLREGVQFHKGYGELTADDVKFSYERFIDPKLDAPYKGDWEALDKVEVTGKYTGVIILKRPFAPLWASTLPVTGGVIVSQKALEEIGLEKYATNPVGTGPYEFGEWAPNQKIVLKRFEDFWGEKPEWDEIHLIPIAEDSAAEIALEAGEVDFSGIPNDAVVRFEANSKFVVTKISTLDYSGVFLNIESPKLKDLAVRQAIRYAVDVPSIIAGAYDGKIDRACGVVAPSQIGYWAEAPCYDQDLVRAKDLLQQVNVTDLALTISILDRENQKAVAEIMQANLAEIGIQSEINVLDDGGYWDLASVKGRDLTVFDWGTTNPDPYWQIVWFSCDQIDEYNWMYWCDKDFDRLNTEATTTLDNAKRSELYIQSQKLWDANANVLWTVRPTDYSATRAGLTPSLTPNGLPVVWNFQSK